MSSSPSRTSVVAFAAAVLVLTMALGFGLIGAFASHPAAAATPFTPTPCPDMKWRQGDPTFTALPNAKAFFGTYDGGLYRIEIPANWNGELVLAAHGFTSNGGPTGDLLQVGFNIPNGPSLVMAPGLPTEYRDHLIQQGFAWAASSYRCNGYIPGVGLQDTMLLRDLFKTANGGVAPKRTYLTGISMGGHITVLGMHEFPQAFDGGLAFCAAGPGLFDWFTSNAAAAEVITGQQFTSTSTLAADTGKVFAATGIAPNLTDKGRLLANVEINTSGGPRPFVYEGTIPYWTSVVSGSGLAGSTDLLARAATNSSTVYTVDAGFGTTSAALNAAVRRKPADATVRGDGGQYNELKPFSGKIEKPLLTVHGTGDMFVPIFLEQDLKRAVDASGRTNLLTQRIVRVAGHCGFSATEVNQAFDDMVAWVRGGAKPDGDSLLGDLSNAGLKFTNPLRSGDPGTLNATPAPPPPLPPATGTLQIAADGGPLGAFGFVLTLLGVVVGLRELRRTVSR